MITKTAIALAGVLAAAPVLVPSTANAQVAVQVQAGQPQGPGHWAQLADGSWVWVPETPRVYMSNDVPYTYYYTPSVGWGWHRSPWGNNHAWRGRYVAPHYNSGGHYNGTAHYNGNVHYNGNGHYNGGNHNGGNHNNGGHSNGGQHHR